MIEGKVVLVVVAVIITTENDVPEVAPRITDENTNGVDQLHGIFIGVVRVVSFVTVFPFKTVSLQ